MPRTCLACESPHRREIDKRLRSSSPYIDIALWLASVGSPIHRTSIARHAKHTVAAVDRPRGPRTVSPNFLQAVVETAHEDLAAGALRPTIRDAIASQSELNRQADRGQDRDLMLKIAMALTGGSNLPRIVGPEVDILEGEFRALLGDGSGDDYYATVRHPRGHDGRKTV
jgi:hypothetical protein